MFGRIDNAFTKKSAKAFNRENTVREARVRTDEWQSIIKQIDSNNVNNNLILIFKKILKSFYYYKVY